MSWTNYTQLWSLGTYQPHSQPSLHIALLDLRSEPEQPGSTVGGDGLGESTAPSPKAKTKAKETADA